MRIIRAMAVRLGDELRRDGFDWRVTRIEKGGRVTIYCEMVVDGVKFERTWVYPNHELVKVTAEN